MNSYITDVNISSRHDVAAAVPETDGIMAAKGTAMGVLFIASTVVGILPFAMARMLSWNLTTPTRTSNRIISMALSFGGGILLATTFLHLLPEVRHAIEDLQATGALVQTAFSLAELLMCVGFFFIYLVSELVHNYVAHRQRLPISKSLECPVPHCPNETNVHATEQNHSSPAISHSHVHLEHGGSNEDTVFVALRGFLIVLALSVHELFEGLALGLEGSTPSVWLFFGAIASHKLVLAFCVGIELLVARTKLWLAMSYILLFAVVSPIGIGIGMVISNLTTSSIVGVILQALATGTLLYVVFFEILKKSGSGLLQFLAVIIGFFVMFGLQQIDGHQHSHDDTGHGHSHLRSHAEHSNGHVDHSHMDDLRQKINILKQAGNLLAQSAERTIQNKQY